jgi:hypothetical protein
MGWACGMPWGIRDLYEKNKPHQEKGIFAVMY